MSAATQTMDAPDALVFQRSESKAVGLRGSLLSAIRNNAPRIVAGFKLASDISVGFSLNPFLMGYTAFAGVGRIITLVYGTKENQRRIAEEHGKETVADNSLLGSVKKILHPRQYPVESSAGFTMMADPFITAYGASQFLQGGTGYTPLILGMAGFLSNVPVVFGQEKKEKQSERGKTDSLSFAHSESKPMGMIGRGYQFMKDNPVLFASLMQLGIVCGYFIGTLIEGLTPAIAVSCCFAVTGIVVQALFVRKNEFNIEGAENAKKPPAPQVNNSSFSPHGGIGAQPA